VATRWFLLAILTGSYGAGAFGMLGISPLSPSLVAGFGLTRLQVALLIPSIYLGGLLFSLPAGRLTDRVGVRPSLLGGLIVGAVGLAVGAAAPAFPAFLFCLFFAGAGWSVVNPALGKAIMDLFPAPTRSAPDTSSRAPRQAAPCHAWPSGPRAIAGSPSGDRCGWRSPAASAPRRLRAMPFGQYRRRSRRASWRSRPEWAPTAGSACSS